ncbi:arsenate reductase/protein-tyrosine-phosphatase family protein [Nocardia callitridis]|uniref:Phosphotyrosine protein phosphatase I domain-containing protein n=1 Tax=Nocardia callitridis TaxID=648753 RepID=A0ABP9KIF6_9NOCA
MHVLFVCHGNVCRSVIAERLTRAVAIEHAMPELTAESAGTRALLGFPVEPLAAKIIDGLGADATNFRARKLVPALIDRADLVLTMTEQIREQVGALSMGAVARTFTLLEAHRIAHVTGARTIEELHSARDDLSLVGRESIADPVGLSEQAYCEVGDRIAEALIPLLLALAPSHEIPPREDDRPGLVIAPGSPPPLAAFLAAQRAR